MYENNSRLQYLESAVAELLRRLADVMRRLAAVEQQPWSGGGGGDGSGGSAESFYLAFPGSSVAGATWTAGAPTAGQSFSSHVYRVSGTGTVDDLGSLTCVNWLPAGLAASKAVIVFPDGKGNYATAGQSCT